jgi:hypothetical protein
MKGTGMKPEALHKIAETIQHSHHQHLGITPRPLKPAHAPTVARLERPDILSFTKALDTARDEWPGHELCLVGAHGALAPTNIDDPTDTLPPGFLQLLDADVLVRIPVGDLEDQDDQID